jgi:hypothetical protein
VAPYRARAAAQSLRRRSAEFRQSNESRYRHAIEAAYGSGVFDGFAIVVAPTVPGVDDGINIPRNPWSVA